MKEAALLFAERFSHWGIEIPEEHVVSRRAGHFSEAGWLIQYCFGKDESGEYLDYYAAHRMTDDRHERIYADGRTKDLPALSTFRLCSPDPVEDARLKRKYDESNRRVTEMLVEKGFDLFTINMSLHAGLGDEDPTDEDESTGSNNDLDEVD